MLPCNDTPWEYIIYLSAPKNLAEVTEMNHNFPKVTQICQCDAPRRQELPQVKTYRNSSKTYRKTRNLSKRHKNTNKTYQKWLKKLHGNYPKLAYENQNFRKRPTNLPESTQKLPGMTQNYYYSPHIFCPHTFGFHERRLLSRISAQNFAVNFQINC